MDPHKVCKSDSIQVHLVPFVHCQSYGETLQFKGLRTAARSAQHNIPSYASGSQSGFQGPSGIRRPPVLVLVLLAGLLSSQQALEEEQQREANMLACCRLIIIIEFFYFPIILTLL